jgi:hypothetical protein
MAVNLDIIQTGSTSATLHVQPGDTITLELANTVQSPFVAGIVAELIAKLGTILGVTFAANTTGGAS